MKILQIIPTLKTGGAEKLLVDIVPRLNRKGIMCDVLTLIDEETPFKQELEKKNVKVIGLSKTMSAYDPRFIIKIKPYLKQYDIVHTHLFQSQYWTGMAKILFSRHTKLITTEHNTSNRRRNIKWIKPIDRFVYKQYNKIISISCGTTYQFIEYLGIREKVFTIPNGIDIDYFKNAIPIERKSLDDRLNNNDFIITMVAGFREQKDQDTLIKAIRYLPDNVKLLLVGDGIRRKECERLAKIENVKERVFFLGIRTDVASILQSSDVVVMSSKWEGFGLAAVEGMAAGKPVIASDVEGLAEIVKGAGLLFSVGDEKELSEKIILLNENKEYSDRVAGACFNRAKKYDVNNMVDSLVEVYYSLLSN